MPFPAARRSLKADPTIRFPLDRQASFPCPTVGVFSFRFFLPAAEQILPLTGLTNGSWSVNYSGWMSGTRTFDTETFSAAARSYCIHSI